MNAQGSILLVDDEPDFARVTIKQFERYGYQCDWAPDSDAARAQLRENRHDVLIADILMPGNPRLEFVKELCEQPDRPPVILVTGKPSVESAAEAVGLPVLGYLIKPFDFEKLVDIVRAAMTVATSRRALRRERDKLNSWIAEIDALDQTHSELRADGATVPVDSMIELTLQRVMDNIISLRDLNRLIQGQDIQADLCAATACPRMARLVGVIQGAIATLEETKTAFKSKQLKKLREDLETAIDELKH